MIERRFLDLANGVFYSFVLKHPKSENPELVIQPPEGHVGKEAPTFEANEVRRFLDIAAAPDLYEALEWALDILDMYDERLVVSGRMWIGSEQRVVDEAAIRDGLLDRHVCDPGGTCRCDTEAAHAALARLSEIAAAAQATSNLLELIDHILTGYDAPDPDVLTVLGRVWAETEVPSRLFAALLAPHPEVADS